MNHPSSKLRFLSGWLPVIGVVLLALALRLVQNLSLPLFVDEGSHIVRAQRGAEGQLVFWNIRKWLYPALLALFRPLGPEAPWLSRTLSALFGAATTGVAISLGRRFGGTRAALGAGLIYAVLPLAVFHERQALADPFLGMLDGLVILVSVWAADRPRLWHVPLLAAALAAAYLTKLSALPYFTIPILACIFLASRSTRLCAAMLSLFGVVTAGIVIALTYTYVLSHSGIPSSVLDITVSSFSELARGEAVASGMKQSATDRVVQGLAYAAGIVPNYIGWSIALLGLIALLLGVRGEHRAEIGFLFFPAVGFALGPMLAIRPVDASRYFVPNALPLAVLAALGLASLLRRVMDGQSRLWVSAAAVLVIITPALWFDAVLIANPRAAPLTAADQAQYLTDRDSVGVQLIAQALLNIRRSEEEQCRVDVLATGEEALLLAAYLGPHVGAFASHHPNNVDQRSQLAAWLASGDCIFLMVKGEEGAVPRTHEGASLAQVGSYSHYDLYQISEVEGNLADEVYIQLTSDPAFMRDDYAALAQALTQAPMAQQVVIFPAVQAAGLIDQTDLNVIPFSVNIWPLTPGAVQSAVDALSQGPDATLIDVVLVDEAHTDPGAIVSLRLQQTLYQIGGNEWFGLLHWQRFLTGPSDPPLTSLGIIYENSISLEAGSILDSRAHPGDFVRIILRWSSPVIIRDSFHVFTHMVGEDETLLAQADFVPLNGLRPMTSWQPGERVVNRFAIEIPADAPPGIYEVRVGIYDPSCGLRLPVTAGCEVGSGYAVLGTLAVQPED